MKFGKLFKNIFLDIFRYFLIFLEDILRRRLADIDNNSLKERRISLTWFNQQYGNPRPDDKIPVERRKSQTENRPASRFGN